MSIANELKHQLTCFRGEWLKHRIQLKRDPSDPDRHRVAYLKRLFTRLEEHRGVTEVQEFKQAYGSSSSPTGKAS